MAQINKQGNLFELQENISSEYRLILLDWMNQVTTDYGMKRQTYHRAIQMCDNFFHKSPGTIPVSDIQLIGITCLHIAAKMEEIYPPHIKSFAESTNDSVTIDQMNHMEIKICETLGWNFDNQQTFFEWATWFMQRWDDYVDESLSNLK